MVRSSICEVLSEVTLISMISPMMEVCGPNIGVLTPMGRFPERVLSFSATICLALNISEPQSNSTQTIEKPADEELRTRRTLVAPLTDVSIGKVTSLSTSSGAMPCASVMTTTVGAVISGKTSTSIRIATSEPISMIRAETSTTSSRFFSEVLMMKFSMVFGSMAVRWYCACG